MQKGAAAPVECAQTAIKTIAICRHLLFHGTGVDAKDGVGRAPAQGAGGQRDNAQPAPPAHRAAGGLADQHQANQYADGAFNIAYVLCHGETPQEVINGAIGHRNGRHVCDLCHKYGFGRDALAGSVMAVAGRLQAATE